MIKKEIPLFKVFMANTVADKVKEVLYSGFIGEGPKVAEFENKISEYTGHNRVLTLNSGTSGLQLAYHIAINHTPNAEIISTPITCTATNTPIITNNAKIVWADVDPISGSIDPTDVERKITKNTKAITMVHWGGNPCDIDKINELAGAHNIKVIEDGAHSMGTQYNGKSLGNESDFVMYSLQAIKHITSIDGGILICKSMEDYKRAKLLRWYGIDRNTNSSKDLRCEIDVVEAGYKAHMNDICATVGIENFAHLNWIVLKHRENALFYNNAFKDIESIGLIPENPRGKAAYWLYTFHVNNRDEVMDKLKEDGIGASKVHSKNDTHSMFKDFRTKLPNAQKFDNTHLCIPVGWWVTKEDREYIAEKVINYTK
tara:strand:+ start:1993 stop:3108 length:1116 start_codon:yes stop_codon:yes gene_type:complete